MFFRVCFLLLLAFPVRHPLAAQSGTADRQLWLQQLDQLARPVFQHLAEGRLKERMPVELAPNVDNPAHRRDVARLEAFGRTLSGIGPWLNGEGGTEAETALRRQYRSWAVQALKQAVNPSGPDYLQWSGGQPLVDASFLALGLVRCPWLWQQLDSGTQRQVVTAFRTTRSTVPVFSNWVLFSGMIEAFFLRYGLEYDPVRIEYAVRQFANHWYVGDGLFSDGMDFHMDYYNSIVIHPYLAAIMEAVGDRMKSLQPFAARLVKIHQRYSELQERSIHTDGAYPVTGRSIAYRGGVFHHLADQALRRRLPSSLQPAQVRGALTAVLRKTLEAPGTYRNGWLVIGLSGPQPGLAEGYITTGSLYLCANLFLPLGLPPSDPFWSAAPAPWTAVKAWSGQDLGADHAFDERR
ncbi:MAG TPA: DUF2264 domain-containing protein [Chitinophagaceae bacterium]|jgi:hypothetical protein|nr:DUF2264 domain-containing protein [Chitinophagaceae bacterium]